MTTPGTGELTSVRSPRVKAARGLAKRTLRQRARAFLAEGPQAVGAALAADAQVTHLFVTGPAWARHRDLVRRAVARGAQVQQVSGEVMAELAQTITPQGLLAVCAFIDIPIDDLAAAGPRLVVILAHVRDPGNAGTVLRTADAAGADGVIFSDASVDPYNSKCVRASAGSIFHVPLVAGVALPAAVAALRERGVQILAGDGRTGRRLDDPDVGERLAAPSAWLFGNEAWGLPPETLSLADDAVAVPIYGDAESLNLAAAAAVCLYASARALRAGWVNSSPAAD